MPTTSLRGAEKAGAGGQVLQHRKSFSSKVTVNDLHMNLENMVSLLNLHCDTIFLTQMHWHEGSPSLPRSRVNLLAQAISPIEAVNHLPPHSWYACTYTAVHRHLPAASWNPEGKPSTAAWNTNWHAKLLTHTKWGPWKGTQLCQLQQPHTTARAAHRPWRIDGGLCVHLSWPPTPSCSSPHGAPPCCWGLLLPWPVSPV